MFKIDLKLSIDRLIFEYGYVLILIILFISCNKDVKVYSIESNQDPNLSTLNTNSTSGSSSTDSTSGSSSTDSTSGSSSTDSTSGSSSTDSTSGSSSTDSTSDSSNTDSTSDSSNTDSTETCSLNDQQSGNVYELRIPDFEYINAGDEITITMYSDIYWNGQVKNISLYKNDEKVHDWGNSLTLSNNQRKLVLPSSLSASSCYNIRVFEEGPSVSSADDESYISRLFDVRTD